MATIDCFSSPLKFFSLSLWLLQSTNRYPIDIVISSCSMKNVGNKTHIFLLYTPYHRRKSTINFTQLKSTEGRKKKERERRIIFMSAFCFSYPLYPSESFQKCKCATKAHAFFSVSMWQKRNKVKEDFSEKN